MSPVLEKPAVQESRHHGPTVRSVAAVAAALLAVCCLPYGLSFPGFPLWAAAWGVAAAATSVTLVVAPIHLQARMAITDHSGIVYLPTDPESQGRRTQSMASLGGPWWSWTCPC